MLNLDLLEQLNKRTPWQYGKQQEVQGSHASSRIISASKFLTSPHKKQNLCKKGNFLSRITFQNKNIQRSQRFHHLNLSISSTKETTQGLIQRYKACYSQRGVTQIHSGRKRFVVRRHGWIQNIANPLLASALLPDMFCNKNNAISPEAIGGDNHSPHPKRLQTRLSPALYQDNQDGCCNTLS